MTEMFTPHPGSRLDATAQAAQQETPEVHAEIGTVSGRPEIIVPVADQLPALGRGYVVVLGAANPVLPLLPQDPKRRSAIVIAVDSAVYLASTRNDAQASAGGAGGMTACYLPAGVAIPVLNAAAWYAAATTLAAPSRVSVLISLDD